MRALERSRLECRAGGRGGVESTDQLRWPGLDTRRYVYFAKAAIGPDCSDKPDILP